VTHQTRPLRAALLRRAASIDGTCPPAQQRAIFSMFPNLDPGKAIPLLDEARQHHLARRPFESERIIHELIDTPPADQDGDDGDHA
jgi:hypothetical protein